MIRYPILIFAGLLSAPLMEIISMIWMQIMPLTADLTANYFATVVLPVALLLHFLMALALWKAFEPAPRSGGVTYLGCHVAAQVAMLSYFHNPVADIALFALMLMISGGLMLFVFNRYFWCPLCAGPI